MAGDPAVGESRHLNPMEIRKAELSPNLSQEMARWLGKGGALNQPGKLVSEKEAYWGYEGAGRGIWRCRKKVEAFLQYDWERTVNIMKKN